MTTVKYKILKGILIAGVVLGFGSGFAHLGARRAMHAKDGRGHCSRSCPDGSRWDRKPDRGDREVAPPAAAPPAAAPPASPAPATPSTDAKDA
jgi:hypothetical protein